MDSPGWLRECIGKEAEHIDIPIPPRTAVFPFFRGSHAKTDTRFKVLQRRVLEEGTLCWSNPALPRLHNRVLVCNVPQIASLPLVSRITVVIS